MLGFEATETSLVVFQEAGRPVEVRLDEPAAASAAHFPTLSHQYRDLISLLKGRDVTHIYNEIKERDRAWTGLSEYGDGRVRFKSRRSTKEVKRGVPTQCQLVAH
jgi:hypothetical protein